MARRELALHTQAPEGGCEEVSPAPLTWTGPSTGGASYLRRPCGPLPAGSPRGTRSGQRLGVPGTCACSRRSCLHTGFSLQSWPGGTGAKGRGGGPSRFGVPTPGPLVSPHLELSPLLLHPDGLGCGLGVRGAPGTPRQLQKRQRALARPALVRQQVHGQLPHPSSRQSPSPVNSRHPAPPLAHTHS